MTAATTETTVTTVVAVTTVTAGNVGLRLESARGGQLGRVLTITPL